MKLATCCFFGKVAFLFSGHQLWWVESTDDTASSCWVGANS